LIDALLTSMATANGAIHWVDLGLNPIALQLGPLALRWYSLAYLFGIVLAWWYLLKLLKQPGAPMARRHADDLVFYATLGVILGGRLGYVLFYKPLEYYHNPVEIVRLWDGGMSFHGGVIGVSLGIFYMAWRQKLDWLRIHDYVACCVPFGLFLGRLANFVNGELWGAPTSLPWGIVFPYAGEVARHPSQLYEAALEGLVLFLVLRLLTHHYGALKRPGLVTGTFLTGYAIARSIAELFREPHYAHALNLGPLTVGIVYSIPMLLAGLAIIYLARTRPLP
jgi:phosphatidylglycerol:prolipoprotein diacylglycerol transferase